MDTQPKSSQELFLEAEEAHRQADLTIGLGESILQKAREVKQRLARQFRRTAGETQEPVEAAQE